MSLMHQRKQYSQTRACVNVLVEVLWAVLALQRPADRVLAAILRLNHQFGARDRRLISETVFAVLRWWGWLQAAAPADWLAAARQARRSNQPSAVPATPQTEWATVLWAAALLEDNPAVFADLQAQWASQAGIEPAAAGAPADLHAKGRQLRALAGAAFTSELLPSQLVPDWVWPVLTPRDRDDAELLQWLQKRPPMWLRTQGDGKCATAGVLAAAGLTVAAHPLLPTALRLEAPRVNLYTLPAFRQGWFEVQDLASQTVGQVCAPQSGQRWWDCCAGGGGKSLQLAELMGRTGTVVASDLRSHKLDDLRKRARRGGYPNIQCRPWDGRALPKQRANFDGVLVDAPCTCSGTWRRNPDGCWRIDAAEIAEMALIQRDILDKVAAAVKPGGVLVYATCSMFDAENQAVVNAFLAAHQEYCLEAVANPLTAAPTAGMVQVWPWDGDCDAMFVARLRRH